MAAAATDIRKLIVKQLVQSWWVALFILVSATAYERAIYHQTETYMQLQRQFEEVENEKKIALAVREELMQQINSHSDHEWIELTLMRGLGLVPEGQIKVFFPDTP